MLLNLAAEQVLAISTAKFSHPDCTKTDLFFFFLFFFSMKIYANCNGYTNSTANRVCTQN